MKKLWMPVTLLLLLGAAAGCMHRSDMSHGGMMNEGMTSESMSHQDMSDEGKMDEGMSGGSMTQEGM